MFEKLYEKYMAFEAPVEKEHPIILGILRYLENTNVKYSQAASGINMTVALDKNTFMYYNALQKERWQTWRTAMYFL